MIAPLFGDSSSSTYNDDDDMHTIQLNYVHGSRAMPLYWILNRRSRMSHIIRKGKEWSSDEWLNWIEELKNSIDGKYQMQISIRISSRRRIFPGNRACGQFCNRVTSSRFAEWRLHHRSSTLHAPKTQQNNRLSKFHREAPLLSTITRHLRLPKCLWLIAVGDDTIHHKYDCYVYYYVWINK